MKWVKSCCDKVDARVQTAYGAWVETGKVGGQKVTSEKHAEMQSMQKAYREAVAMGEVDKILDMKFREEYV
jgi:hypothetical protein